MFILLNKLKVVIINSLTEKSNSEKQVRRSLMPFRPKAFYLLRVRRVGGQSKSDDY